MYHHAVPGVDLSSSYDRTVAYIVNTRPAFEDLLQVASQLAGLLVLVASGASPAATGHPVVAAAREKCRDAAEAVRSARPTEQARLHHDYVLLAATALESAVAAAGERLDPAGVEGVLAPLRAGYEHLRRASQMLPGFELISFMQACCTSVDRGGRMGGIGRTGGTGRIVRSEHPASSPSRPSSLSSLPDPR